MANSRKPNESTDDPRELPRDLYGDIERARAETMKRKGSSVIRRGCLAILEPVLAILALLGMLAGGCS